MENIKTPVASPKKQAGLSGKNNRQTLPMTTLTTNRLLTNALRTLCCVGALTACSTWATVVNWQLNAGGSVGATKDLSQSKYTTAAWGIDNAPGADDSRGISFKAASAGETSSAAGSVNNKVQVSEPSEAVGTLHIKQTSDTNVAVDGILKNKSQTNDNSIQQESHSAGSKQPEESPLLAPNAPSEPTVPLGGAIAAGFDEDFVSVPTVQFAATTANASAAAAANVNAAGPKEISMNSQNATTVVPEMSAFFPIIGLIAAVSCTQILRRRRAAQQSAPRSLA